jgi:hypothetical protein
VARKLAFVLATFVAFCIVPHVAHSTCSGTAGNTAAGKGYGISQSKRAQVLPVAKNNAGANIQSPPKSAAPAVPPKAATLPQCRRPCVANDASAKRAAYLAIDRPDEGRQL